MCTVQYTVCKGYSHESVIFLLLSQFSNVLIQIKEENKGQIISAFTIFSCPSWLRNNSVRSVVDKKRPVCQSFKGFSHLGVKVRAYILEPLSVIIRLKRKDTGYFIQRFQDANSLRRISRRYEQGFFFQVTNTELLLPYFFIKLFNKRFKYVLA